MGRRKPIPAPFVPNDATRAAWHRAAVLCLTAPPIFGVDTHQQCAEHQIGEALRARLDFVGSLLARGGMEQDAAWLVSGAGESGPDRLVAAWWSNIYIAKAARVVGQDGAPIALLDRPVRALVDDGLMSPAALPVFEGDGDLWLAGRAMGRRMIAQVTEHIASLAKGDWEGPNPR